MTSPSTSTLAPSRRTVVRGAAWAVPAVAFATQAPAFANSRECLTIPQIGSWRQRDQDVNEKPFRFINGGKTLEAIIDWAWWDRKPRPAFGYGWASTSLEVQPGHSYVINLGLETCKGYNWPGSGSPETCETNNTTLEVLWTPTGGETQTLFKGATQDTTGFTSYEPIVNCTGAVNNRPPLWKKFPDASVAFEVPCGGPQTGRLELRFTAYPHSRISAAGNPRTASRTRFSNQNNDDWRVTPTIVSCTRLSDC